MGVAATGKASIDQELRLFRSGARRAKRCILGGKASALVLRALVRIKRRVAPTLLGLSYCYFRTTRAFWSHIDDVENMRSRTRVLWLFVAFWFARSHAT